MTAVLSYCDDCGRKAGLPISDPWAGVWVPSFYGRCPRCNIIRACYGVDPEPRKPRQPSIPLAVQEWQRGRNYR